MRKFLQSIMDFAGDGNEYFIFPTLVISGNSISICWLRFEVVFIWCEYLKEINKGSIFLKHDK